MRQSLYAVPDVLFCPPASAPEGWDERSPEPSYLPTYKVVFPTATFPAVSPPPSALEDTDPRNGRLLAAVSQELELPGTNKADSAFTQPVSERYTQLPEKSRALQTSSQHCGFYLPLL